MAQWINENLRNDVDAELESLKKFIDILMPLSNAACVRILRYCSNMVAEPAQSAAGMDIQPSFINSWRSNVVKKRPENIKSGKFIIKDSGKRQEFNTGAVRDVDDEKPRYELIPVLALRRVAMHYANGAKKYSDDNWKKGMSIRRVYGSLLRHAFAFGEGDTCEDHLAAIIFNAMAIIHYQETKREDIDDMPKDKRANTVKEKTL